jgi:NAD(P)-dependent dehydrogenase (short-subunit alcohol dehydrogenase family)
VNNAGYMNVGRVVDVDPEEALRQLDALVVAPMHLAALALPAMRRRGSGRIVNVSSSIAYGTAAMTGWYQSAKHALSAVTDALGVEVAEDGIDVVLIEPGGLDTGIWDKSEADLRRRREQSGDRTAYDRALKLLHTTRPYMPGPDRAAEAIGTALTAGRPDVHYKVGWDVPLVRLSGRLLPDRVQDRVLRAVLGR